MKVAEDRTSADVAIAAWCQLVATPLAVGPLFGFKVPWWGFGCFVFVTWGQMGHLMWRDAKVKVEK